MTTIGEFASNWLELKSYTLSPLTLNNYRATVDRFILPYFGFETLLSDITPLKAQSFVQSLLAAYTPSTVKRKYSVFRSMMNKAADYGLCSSLRGIELPKTSKKRTEISCFFDENLRILIKNLSFEPVFWRNLVFLALDSGARRGEIVGLKWSDLDFNTGFLEIKRSAYKAAGGVALKTPKNGKSRTIALSRRTLSLFKEFYIKSGQKEGFIFSLNGGADPVYPDSVSHWFSRFTQKNGLDGYHFHCLRHTCATSLIRAGVDLKVVSDRLGHSSIAVTELYLHSNLAADEAAAKVLERYYFD